jgi:hypothetical protein
VVGALVVGAVASCAGTTVRERPVDPPASSGDRTPEPGPTRTIVHNARVYPAGTPAALSAQAGVSLRLTAGRPEVSRTRLSSSYGYPPAHGYYVTFRLTVRNTGSKPIALSPADFVLRIQGEQGRLDTNDGNAPYSGASAQLDPTILDPGDVVRSPLTFDAGGTHGRLAYAPDGSAAIVWTF